MKMNDDLTEENFVYIGELENGKFEGEGTLMKEGSVVYKGGWKVGVKHG